MAETAEEEIKTEKVFDLTQGKYIDKPIEGEQGINEKRPIYDPTPAEEKPAEEKPAEEPKTEPTVKTDAEPEKQADVPKPDEVKFEPGSYLKEKYSEKFGIESEKDLEDILESQDKLVKVAEAAQARVKELESKPAEPVYRTDQEKKIAEFLKPYDPSKFGEGLNTVASLMAMDPTSVSGKTAMEEAYILNHPEYTRDEAKEMFTEEVWPKYQLDKDNFDSDEAYNRAKRISDLKLKSEEAQARKLLAEKKEQLKSAPEEKKDKTPVVDTPQIPAETIQAYSQEIEKFFNPAPNKFFDRLNYMSDDGKEVLASVILDKDKLEKVKELTTLSIQNPAMYDKNGKIDKFAPQELVKNGLRLLYGDWLEDQLWKQVKVVASRLKAEQIAGTTPDKKSIGGGDVKLGVTEQFAELAAKEKAKRQR